VMPVKHIVMIEPTSEDEFHNNFQIGTFFL